MKPGEITLISLMLLFFLPNYAQSAQEIIIVKINQSYEMSKWVDSYNRISYPNETNKTIKLEKAGFKIDDADEDANSKTIQIMVNSILKEGYQIYSTSISGDYKYTRTIMIFIRKTE